MVAQRQTLTTPFKARKRLLLSAAGVLLLLPFLFGFYGRYLHQQQLQRLQAMPQVDLQNHDFSHGWLSSNSHFQFKLHHPLGNQDIQLQLHYPHAGVGQQLGLGAFTGQLQASNQTDPITLQGHSQWNGDTEAQLTIKNWQQGAVQFRDVQINIKAGADRQLQTLNITVDQARWQHPDRQWEIEDLSFSYQQQQWQATLAGWHMDDRGVLLSRGQDLQAQGQLQMDRWAATLTAPELQILGDDYRQASADVSANGWQAPALKSIVKALGKAQSPINTRSLWLYPRLPALLVEGMQIDTATFNAQHHLGSVSGQASLDIEPWPQEPPFNSLEVVNRVDSTLQLQGPNPVFDDGLMQLQRWLHQDAAKAKLEQVKALSVLRSYGVLTHRAGRFRLKTSYVDGVWRSQTRVTPLFD